MLASGALLRLDARTMKSPRLDLRLLRLLLVTDGRGDVGRLERIVGEAVQAGVRCVQLREPQLSARGLLHACERLMPVLQAAGGMLLVNDRLDVAAAAHAHGAQVGHRSLPPEIARAVLGPTAVLGYSAHDQAELDLAVVADCDFALLSPVWATSSKPDAASLGVAQAANLTSKARLPVLWLGGVGVQQLEELATVVPAKRPIGVAVRSGIMGASDPGAATAGLLQALALVPAEARPMP